MTSPDPVELRRWLVAGEPDAVAATVDVLTITADVRGAVELDDGRVDIVFALPAGRTPPEPVAGVEIAELPPPDPDAAAPTGLEDDRPIRVAPDLLVRPPWVARPADFAGVELVVPRGMAFGSGEHGSTKAALRVLHAVLGDPATVLDVGSGSGILLAYAAHRGIASLAACDVEEPACRATRELVPTADVRLGGPDVFAPDTFDAVIASLDARQLTAALPALIARWNRRGVLVVGGMRPHEVDAVVGGGRVAALVGDVRGGGPGGSTVGPAVEPAVRIEDDGWVALGYRAGP